MEPSQVDSGGFGLLYVEDEAETREIISRALALEYPHASLQTAADGAEGLALFREHRPQVVITDVRMPVMDGIRMAREIKAIDPDTALIALTAYSDADFLMGAIEAGFNHYVLKPIDFDKLFAAIGKSLKVVKLKWQINQQNERMIQFNADLEKRVEELRGSEQRLRATFDQAAVGVAHIALDGSFLRLNRKYCDIAGCSPEDPTSLNIFDFTHPDDLPMCMEHHHLLLEGKTQSYSLEKRYIHDDGSIIWATLTISMVYDEDGNPGFMVGVIDDITTRKRAEEERERLLVQHEAVLDSIHEGVIISDMEGKVLSMNPAALALHQYQTVEQVRQQAHLFQDRFEIMTVHGGPVPFEQWPIARALRGERFTDYELCVRRKDTRNEFIASYSGTPVRTRHGDAMLAVVTLRDITERKLADEELRLSELKLSTIFHSVPALIAITTLAEEICVDINEAGLRMLGYDRSEIVGHSLLELGVWESRSARDRMIRLVQEEGKARDEELNLRRKNGSTITVLYTKEPIDFGGERFLLSVVNDISQRKELEEQIASLNAALAVRATELQSANRDLEAFNYTVAHDLRKPLTVINGYCQVLAELCSENLDEDCRGYIKAAMEGTLRMDRLIDALLLFSSSAHAEPRREAVDLSATAEAVAAELKLAEPERDVTFRIDPNVKVQGDANLLRAVISNLFGNAWKYTSDRTEAVIEFGAAELDGKETFFIRDNGIGFDMKEAGDMFTPFRRLPGGQRIGGLGIGLATVERIIQRHGGKVWAEGEPGKGAAFYFTL